MEPRQIFGQNMRQVREQTGLSQEALGEAAGLHMTEISRLERGVRDPRLATIIRVSRALKVPASLLIDGIQ